MVEKRRARRFVLDLEIMEINGKAATGAKLLDLSANGARLDLPLARRLGEQLGLLILLPGLKKPSKFFVRVVWKRPPDQAGRHIIGVQFYQNNWELDQWLRQQSHKPG
jgi:hypothetical protein